MAEENQNTSSMVENSEATLRSVNPSEEQLLTSGLTPDLQKKRLSPRKIIRFGLLGSFLWVHLVPIIVLFMGIPSLFVISSLPDYFLNPASKIIYELSGINFGSYENFSIAGFFFGKHGFSSPGEAFADITIINIVSWVVMPLLLFALYYFAYIAYKSMRSIYRRNKLLFFLLIFLFIWLLSGVLTMNFIAHI